MSEESRKESITEIMPEPVYTLSEVVDMLVEIADEPCNYNNYCDYSEYCSYCENECENHDVRECWKRAILEGWLKKKC